MGRVFALEFGIPPLLGEEKDKLLILEGVGVYKSPKSLYGLRFDF
jgi:hypothetical protein